MKKIPLLTIWHSFPDTKKREWGNYQNFRGIIAALRKKGLVQDSEVINRILYIPQHYYGFFLSLENRYNIHIHILLYNQTLKF